MALVLGYDLESEKRGISLLPEGAKIPVAGFLPIKRARMLFKKLPRSLVVFSSLGLPL